MCDDVAGGTTNPVCVLLDSTGAGQSYDQAETCSGAQFTVGVLLTCTPPGSQGLAAVARLHRRPKRCTMILLTRAHTCNAHTSGSSPVEM